MSNTDKLVSMRGTVVKASTVKPLVIKLNFACEKCTTEIPRTFPDGKFSPPTACTLHGCKSRTFKPIRSIPVSEEVKECSELIQNDVCSVKVDKQVLSVKEKPKSRDGSST